MFVPRHSLKPSLPRTEPLQEGVALEIAEAVIGALRGDLAATAVNAPMVPAEVLPSPKKKLNRVVISVYILVQSAKESLA
jgi:hypothetical protein